MTEGTSQMQIKGLKFNIDSPPPSYLLNLNGFDAFQ